MDIEGDILGVLVVWFVGADRRVKSTVNVQGVSHTRMQAEGRT